MYHKNTYMWNSEIFLEKVYRSNAPAVKEDGSKLDDLAEYAEAVSLVDDDVDGDIHGVGDDGITQLREASVKLQRNIDSFDEFMLQLEEAAKQVKTIHAKVIDQSPLDKDKLEKIRKRKRTQRNPVNTLSKEQVETILSQTQQIKDFTSRLEYLLKVKEFYSHVS